MAIAFQRSHLQPNLGLTQTVELDILLVSMIHVTPIEKCHHSKGQFGCFVAVVGQSYTEAPGKLVDTSKTINKLLFCDREHIHLSAG